MKKLVFILLILFGIFTYIRAYEKTESSISEVEAASVISAEIPVEITH